MTVNIIDPSQPSGRGNCGGGAFAPDYLELRATQQSLGNNRPGAEKKASLSHSISRRDFGGERDVMGLAMNLNGKSSVIIGVMPPGFNFPVNEQLWVPLFNEFPVLPPGDAQSLAPAMLCRLKPRATATQATTEIITIA